MAGNKENKKEATLDDVVEALQGMQNKLEEMLVWQRINGASKVRELLISTLGTPEKKLVYHLSDGKPTKEIVDASKVSAGAVSGYWKTWKNLGLMKTQKVMGGERSIRIFDLEDFGIAIPKVEAASKQKTTNLDQTMLTPAPEQTSPAENGGISK